MVDVTFNIQYQDNAPVLPLVATPRGQYGPGGGYLRPWYHNSNTVGTGSGDVNIRVLTRPSANDDPVFLSVVRCVAWSNHIVADEYISFGPNDGTEWTFGNNAFNIPNPTTVADQQVQFVSPQNPYAFGQLRAGVVGEVSVNWQDDISGKNYKVSINGWISDRPFLTPMTVFPG